MKNLSFDIMQEYFYNGKGMIFKAFKNRIFPFYHEKRFEGDEDEDKNVRNENGFIEYNKLVRIITLNERDTNNDLVTKHFQAQNLSALFKKLLKLKNKKKNNIQVSLIKSTLKDLKKEIGEMSRDEIEIEHPNEIVDIVEIILEFNRQNQPVV